MCFKREGSRSGRGCFSLDPAIVGLLPKSNMKHKDTKSTKREAEEIYLGSKLDDTCASVLCVFVSLWFTITQLPKPPTGHAS